MIYYIISEEHGGTIRKKPQLTQGIDPMLF